MSDCTPESADWDAEGEYRTVTYSCGQIVTVGGFMPNPFRGPLYALPPSCPAHSVERAIGDGGKSQPDSANPLSIGPDK